MLNYNPLNIVLLVIKGDPMIVKANSYLGEKVISWFYNKYRNKYSLNLILTLACNNRALEVRYSYTDKGLYGDCKPYLFKTYVSLKSLKEKHLC